MSIHSPDSAPRPMREYESALLMLRTVPDHSAVDVGELAERIGADKLELIQWMRAHITFARLIESKVVK
jgi:hypothetical protein